MENLAALRAAVFSLSAKNLRGADNRPPGRAQVNVIQTSKSRLAAGSGAAAHPSSPMTTTVQHDSAPADWGTCRQDPVQIRLLIQRLTRFDYAELLP